MTNTAAFSFRPETEDRGYAGQSDTLPGAIDGAWKLSRYLEDFIVIRDHRDDPEGIAIARVGLEWLDTMAASGRDYDAELSPEEDVPTVRQTTCELCSLDVEVDLEDIGLLTRDRGGSARCPDGKVHEPLLSSEDYDAHEYHTGVTVG